MRPLKLGVRAWTDADNLQCEFAVIVRDDMKGERLGGTTLMNKMIDYVAQEEP